MPEWRKAAWGIGSVIVLPVGAVGVALGTSGFFDDGQHETFRQALLGVSYVAFAAYFSAWIAAMVYVNRRQDFAGGRQTRWLWILFFFNGFVLPYFWWRFIRPLPSR